MLNLTLRLSMRFFRRNIFYTCLNVICLTIGLTSFFMIMLFVSHEQSFDRFHSKSNRIFRLTSANAQRHGAIVPYKWGEILQNEWAEVEKLVSFQNITIALTVKNGDDYFAQHGFIGADSTFFDVFDFPILKGDVNHVLQSPNKMLITPNMARKYFGDVDPIGRQLSVNLWGTMVTFEIEGVVVCPENSHIQFKFIIPIEPVKKHFFDPSAFDSWKIHFAYTYVLLSDPTLFEDREENIDDYFKSFLARHVSEEYSNRVFPKLEPLEDIYLKSQLGYDFPPRGDINHVYILSIVAFGVLILAIINYININMALSLKRLKEFGLKKILGSQRTLLILQFFMESLIMTLLSFLQVVMITILLIPQFNEITGKTLEWQGLISGQNLTFAIISIILVAFVSGLYPAMMLTFKKPLHFLADNTNNPTSDRKFQKVLVITQFAVSILLIMATTTVYKQVEFMRTKDLGFDKDNVLIMDDARNVAANIHKIKLLRERLVENSMIENVSASSSYPGQHSWSTRYIPEGFEENESMSILTIYADHDFMDTYDIRILEGRGFNKKIYSDSINFLINESAAGLFQSKDSSWFSPLGKKLRSSDDVPEGRVIGLFKDFHLSSVRDEIRPLIIAIDTRNNFAVQIEVREGRTKESVDIISKEWKELFPETPFSYAFLDEIIEDQYGSEQKLSTILQIFSVLSLSVALLGLFGLTSFMVHQKSKELSIRKVVGAEEWQLLTLLSWTFLKLVLLALLIAIPLGILLINSWLADYAYRTEIPGFIMFTAILITIMLTLLTVGYHAWKGANMNPVEVLNRA